MSTSKRGPSELDQVPCFRQSIICSWTFYQSTNWMGHLLKTGGWKACTKRNCEIECGCVLPFGILLYHRPLGYQKIRTGQITLPCPKGPKQLPHVCCRKMQPKYHRPIVSVWPLLSDQRPPSRLPLLCPCAFCVHGDLNRSVLLEYCGSPDL